MLSGSSPAFPGALRLNRFPLTLSGQADGQQASPGRAPPGATSRALSPGPDLSFGITYVVWAASSRWAGSSTTHVQEREVHGVQCSADGAPYMLAYVPTMYVQGK